jgi:hypothetical protein
MYPVIFAMMLSLEGIMDNNGHKPGEVMNDRRGVNRDELSDHDRLVLLESRVDRIYEFMGVFKDAFGRLWAWLNGNVRGQG